MAAITPTLTEAEGGTWRYVWTPVTEADTCNPVTIPGARDRTVQVKGTFGGTTVTVEGTLDASSSGTYAGLTDPFGNAISFTSAGIDTITENTTWTKPVVTGGTGVSLTITMLAGRTI